MMLAVMPLYLRSAYDPPSSCSTSSTVLLSFAAKVAVTVTPIVFFLAVALLLLVTISAHEVDVVTSGSMPSSPRRR